MRKLATAILVSAITAASLPAAEAEQFFYERGFENGYKAGYERGVKEGIKIAKQVLLRWRDSIRAYEAGKYLVRSKALTYPQVWQTRDENGVRLVVTPAKIENEVDIDGLFKRFGYNLPTAPSDLQIEKALNENKEALNSVRLIERDNPSALPAPANKDAQITTMRVKKTYKNRKILDKANVVYQDDGDSYTVMFFSATEKRDFCSNFRDLCMGE